VTAGARENLTAALKVACRELWGLMAGQHTLAAPILSANGQLPDIPLRQPLG
jgi:hypothetical protein